MDKLIAKYAENITNELGNDLEALMLVGSFARGEGIKGLSDIEFWAVVKDLSRVKKPQLGKNISLGFTTRSHLKRLKPYIYTVEVKKFGRVLYGDENIVSHIPDYSFEDIAPADGFILLNNRIVEQMILLNKIEDGEVISQYEFDKGYVQLVNSLLVLNRRYRSLYPEKLKEFMEMSQCHNVTMSQDLVNRVQQAFASMKQAPELIIDQSEALEKWVELREHFRMVWMGQRSLLSRLLGKPVRWWIYYKSSKLYFSNDCTNRQKRNSIIKKWERFVK